MNFMKRIKLTLLRNTILAASLCVTVFSPLHADDTEIFFGQSNDAFETTPNILFVLDVSTSMINRSVNGVTQLNIMKEAINSLLQNTTEHNVGLMTFKGRNAGATVRYPVSDLDARASEFCPDGVCGSESILVRSQNPSDDATQNNQNLDVSVYEDFLVLGNVSPNTVDIVAGRTSADANSNAANDTNLLNVTQKQFFATGSAQENAFETSDQYRWRRNQQSNVWFNQLGYEPSLFGYQFDNVDIPRNAQVTNAILSFRLGAGNQGSMSAFVTGEQTADPEPHPTATTGFTTDNHTLEERSDISNRTNESLFWEDLPAPFAGTAESGSYISSPNMEGIVNEIVNLPSWESGNTMSFIVSPRDDFIQSDGQIRTFHGAGSDSKPALTVTYEELEPDDSPVNIITVTNTEHIDQAFHLESGTVWQNTSNKSARLFYVGGDFEPRQLALRFPNVNVPRGAEITSVRLRMEALSPAVASDAKWEDWTQVSGTKPAVAPAGNDSVFSSASDKLIKLNIHAELSANPISGDNSKPLIVKDLTKTTGFITWDAARNKPDNNGSRNPIIESPNLNRIVQESIDLPEWQNGNTLSLIIAPDGGYDNNNRSLVHVLTSSSDSKPTLEIAYREPEDTKESTNVDHTAAIRFRNVNIPQGAIIESARVVMRAAAANGSTAKFQIFGERTENSQAFKVTSNDVGMRQLTAVSTEWNAEVWKAAGNLHFTPDISNVIQEITDQNNWCAGNALSLMIQTEIGNRFAQSHDADPINAPALQIKYRRDNNNTNPVCSNTSVAAKIIAKDDDIAQAIGGGTFASRRSAISTLHGLNNSSNNAIGLRFSGLQIPQGAEITGADIELVASKNLPNAFEIGISMEQQSNSAPLSNNNTLLNRQFTAEETWNHPGGLINGDNMFTADLTTPLKTVINNPGWTSGNAVTFKLEAHSGELEIVSRDGDQASKAQLRVHYQVFHDVTSEDIGAKHGEEMQRIVDGIATAKGTPIVSSLYEAGKYFRGEQVDYGTDRGDEEPKNTRLSHMGSYEGGAIVRNSDCTEDDLSHPDCFDETIASTPTPPIYKSPIGSQCQSNHIVLLSGGSPTTNTAAQKIRDLTGEECNPSYAQSAACGPTLLNWMNTTDQSSEFAEDQTIKTHVIAFNIARNSTRYLQELAAAGGGKFETASTASDLLGSFKRIFNNVSQRNASFVSPGATVSQFNRLRNSDDVYYAMFQPSSTASWQGNLKRYSIGLTDNDEFAVFDSNDKLAVDAAEGTFFDTSKSFWSTETDGNDVTLGGASGQISDNSFPDFTHRNVYTFNTNEALEQKDTDLTVANNAFSPTNALLNKEAFELPSIIESDTAAFEELVAWAKGADVNDEDGDENTTDLRAFMGDPMHSAPLVVNYHNGESVIYIATNEGFLHAIDTDDGKEHFAFIPELLYENIYDFYQNDVSLSRPYGLDGGKMLWHDDANDDGLIDGDETAILYIAMRRGGSSYFALDVSDYENPKYLWSIQGRTITEDEDPTTANGDYSDLSSTWSLPVKTKIMDGNTPIDVIVFGGGYDEDNQDPTEDTSVNGVLQPSIDTRSEDNIGNAIFIADARTGERLWKSDFADMDYSIPSDVRVLDVNFDGMADQLYVGDMGGQLWRMDFNSSEDASKSIDDRISADVMAEIAGSTPESNRKFYYPPDIAAINVDGRQLLSISIGSGWRAHPLDDIVEDRIYNFRSPFVLGPPVDSLGELRYPTTLKELDLLDVTNRLDGEVRADDPGWFLRLENKGEKVLASSLTFNNQLILTTYKPADLLFTCDAAIGSGSVYIMNIFNGAPELDLNDSGGDLTIDDRSRALANPGLPPGVSILFPEASAAAGHTDPLFQVGKENISEVDGGSELNGGSVSGTTFWQEVTENHDE